MDLVFEAFLFEGFFEALEVFFGQFLSFFVVGEFFDVEAVAFGGGDSARGGVRLIDEAFVFEKSHVVANRGRAYGKSVIHEHGFGADGLGGVDEVLDDGGKDFTFAGVEGEHGGDLNFDDDHFSTFYYRVLGICWQFGSIRVGPRVDSRWNRACGRWSGFR